MAARRSAKRRYADALQRHVGTAPSAWRTTRKPGQPWLSLTPPYGTLPRQGWKLHVSIGAADAPDMVDRLLPALFQAGQAFKIIAALGDLVRLNAGALGTSQVGKVVTVYPADEAAMVGLIAACRAVLPPRSAPAIPSDKPVDVERGLWIRYGVFQGDPISDALGRLSVPLMAPDGTTIEDRRSYDGEQASWAPPPPVPLADWAREDLGRPIAIGDATYVRLRLIQQRAGTSSALGIALTECRPVIVKSAVKGEGANACGEDATDRLSREHRMLNAAAALDCCPGVLGYDPERHILVEEDLGNDVLSTLPSERAVALLPEIAASVGRLHAAGYVHRDLKLANVVQHQGGARLIDFESCAAIGSPGRQGFLKTLAYSAPEALRRPVAPSLDLFALGGCITHACLGMCAGYLPHDRNPERQVALLRLSGQAHAAAIVGAVTAGDPAARPTADDLQRQLTSALPMLRSEHEKAWAYRPVRPEQPAAHLAMATKAGRATRAFRQRERHGYSYRNRQSQAAFTCRSINIGAAGIAIGLMTIDAAQRADAFRTDVLGACAWLAASAPDPRAHGLFSGNAGVAVALAVAGSRYGRDDLIAASHLHFDAALCCGMGHPDLFSGRAGILWAAVMLAEVLGDETPLAAVEPLARSLVAEATMAGDGPGWPAHPDYDTGRAIYHGAAHGSAGIALGLAAWGRATGDGAASALALETFVSLHESGNAGRVRSGGDAAHPPKGEATRWCHGIAGYLWCLLQALPGHPLAGEALTWAAGRLAAAPWPLKDTTLCHGLAGFLETWRMATAEPAITSLAGGCHAQGLAALELLAQARRGTVVWGAEEPTRITPDLWVGFLGPACATAMGAAGAAVSILSPAWLARCARATVHDRPRHMEQTA